MNEIPFVRLSRKFFTHCFWEEKRIYSKAEALLDLIRSARFGEGLAKSIIQHRLVKYNRGELVASIRYLSKRWKWSRSRTERFITLLKNEEIIETRIESGVTVIKLCKYELYNNARDTNEDNQNDNAEDGNKDSGGDKEEECKEGIEKKEHTKEESQLHYNKEGESFAEWFRLQLPVHLQNPKKTALAKWIETYDKLRRIDKYTDAEIRKLCQWARDDEFWSTNFLSPVKLRRKNKDGIAYSEVFKVKSSANSKPVNPNAGRGRL